MRRTGKMVLACLLAASAMLTACGGSGDTGSAGTTTQASAIGKKRWYHPCGYEL